MRRTYCVISPRRRRCGFPIATVSGYLVLSFAVVDVEKETDCSVMVGQKMPRDLNSYLTISKIKATRS